MTQNPEDLDPRDEEYRAIVDRAFSQPNILQREDTEPVPLVQPGLTGTAKEFESKGLFDDLTTRHTVETGESEDRAWEGSSAALLGEWGNLDEKGKKEWVESTRSWAEWGDSFWSGVEENYVKPRRKSLEERAQRQGFTFDLERDADPIQGWLERKVGENRARNQRRKFYTDLVEQGKAPAATQGTARNVTEQAARGFFDTGIGGSIAGAGRALEIVRNRTAMLGTKIPSGTALKAFGDWVSAKAEEYFPTDPVRQEEFQSVLGNGAGTMLAFMGPSAAAALLARAGPRTIAALAAESPEMAAMVAAQGAQRAKIVGTSVSGGMGATMNAESLAREAEGAQKAGKPVTDWDVERAFMMGLPVGATEALPIMNWFNGPQGGFTRGVLREMLEEGPGQEMLLQGLGNNLIAQATFDPERNWDEGIWEAGLAGAILSGSVETSRRAVASMRNQPDQPLVQEAKAKTGTMTDASPAPAEEAQPAIAAGKKTRTIDLDGFTPAQLQNDPADRTVPGPEINVGPDGQVAPRIVRPSDAPEFDAYEFTDDLISNNKPIPPDLPDDDLDEALAFARNEGKADRRYKALADELQAVREGRDSEAAQPNFIDQIADAVSDPSATPVIEQVAQVAEQVAADPAMAQQLARAANLNLEPASEIIEQGAEALKGYIDSIAGDMPGLAKMDTGPADTSDSAYKRLVSVLAGKTTRTGWAKATKVSDKTLQTLLDRAEKDGLVRKDSSGNYRRGKDIKQAIKGLRKGAPAAQPRAAAPAPAAAPAQADTFAQNVMAAASRVQDRIGDRVPISLVYAEFAKTDPAKRSIDTFKKQLVERGQNRTLDLSRADLPEMMPGGQANLAASETAWNGDRVHYVRLPEAAAPASPLPAPRLSIPADMRIEKAIGARERKLRRALPPYVTGHARDIERALGTPEMDAVIERLTSDEMIRKAEMHDLAALVGKKVPKSATKKAALQTILDRHNDATAARVGAVLEQEPEPDADSTAVLEDAGRVLEEGVSQLLQEIGAIGPVGEPSGRDRAGSGEPSSGPDGGFVDEIARGDGRTDAVRGIDPADGARDRPSRPVAGPAEVLTDEQRAEVAAKVEADKKAADQKRRDRETLNYQITVEDKIGQGGPKGKIRANIAAIKVLRTLEDEGRGPTEAEKKVLVRYTGWGAFSEKMFEDRNPEFKKEREEFRSLVSNDEYEAARNSTRNAHYTSPDVVNAMWQAMEHLGFKGGRAIEPGAGSGNFIGLTPSNIREATEWTAVELDPLTGGIAKNLYQAADVRVQGYQETKFPDGFFDLAISNVPFSSNRPYDAEYKGKFVLHDYYFLKSLDKVRPGGIVAFITSSGTMDKKNAAARREMAKRADLVGSIRLPGGSQGAFKGNAGTDVTTDIIFLRKRIEGERDLSSVMVDIDYTNADGEQETARVAANKALSMVEKRTEGLRELLRCLG